MIFFAMSTLNYEDFWIDPDEDEAKLLNTERNINFSKGLKKGSNEEKMNVIRNLLSVNSTIETIAVAVGLSVDEVENIIKKQEISKNND